MMRRRDFVIHSAAAAIAVVLPLTAWRRSRSVVAASPEASPFRLARLDRLRNVFAPLQSCDGSECTSSNVRLRFDAFQHAEPRPMLYGLRVHALFDVPGASGIPYLVWDHRAQRREGDSSGVSFIAGRESMRELALDYRVDDSAPPVRVRCALTDAGSPLLEPGQYVLAGPRAPGRAADLERFIYSGTPAQPLIATDGEPRTFDYLAFRIEALA